jgi:hypothetical protein
MNQDEQQLQLLSIFHYVVAGMVAFLSCIPFIHLVVGVLFVTGNLDHGKNQPPAIIGWVFIAVASAVILSGWTLAALLVSAGRFLKRRVHHTFCCVAAGVACMFMPLGTALGVFTLIVLMRPSVKALFDVRARPAAAT